MSNNCMTCIYLGYSDPQNLHCDCTLITSMVTWLYIAAISLRLYHCPLQDWTEQFCGFEMFDMVMSLAAHPCITILQWFSTQKYLHLFQSDKIYIAKPLHLLEACFIPIWNPVVVFSFKAAVTLLWMSLVIAGLFFFLNACMGIFVGVWGLNYFIFFIQKLVILGQIIDMCGFLHF